MSVSAGTTQLRQNSGENREIWEREGQAGITLPEFLPQQPQSGRAGMRALKFRGCLGGWGSGEGTRDTKGRGTKSLCCCCACAEFALSLLALGTAGPGCVPLVPHVPHGGSCSPLGTGSPR